MTYMATLTRSAASSAFNAISALTCTALVGENLSGSFALSVTSLTATAATTR